MKKILLIFTPFYFYSCFYTYPSTLYPPNPLFHTYTKVSRTSNTNSQYAAFRSIPELEYRINDSEPLINIRLIMPTGMNEGYILDTLFIYTETDVYSLIATQKQNKEYIHNSTSTSSETKSENISITIPETCKTITLEDGTKKEIKTPSKTVTEKINYDVEHTEINSRAQLFNNLSFYIHKNDWIRIQESNILRFAIRTTYAELHFSPSKRQLNQLKLLIRTSNQYENHYE